MKIDLAKLKGSFNAKKYLVPALIGAEAIVILLVVLYVAHVVGVLKVREARELTAEEQIALSAFRQEVFKERNEGLKATPYEKGEHAVSLTAASAILVDADTGAVIYKKNADEMIPPASMTKLVVMYIAFKEIASGRIHYDDIVPLPRECWASSLPSDSSLMFLDKGQTVTLKELLTGLAVASGNDAAIAIAYYISGGVEPFVARMNAEMRALGLTVTHFVEPSGYSELNMTTAREFATFARRYISDYPDSINLFHSCKEIYYPLKKNLPADLAAKYGDTKAIHQTNTNPLLNRVEGVDGLKTGFIYESGYNLALTAKRGERRYLSVTMRGAGKGSYQGQANRVKDGTALLNLAFNQFDDYREKSDYAYTVRVLGSKSKSVRIVSSLPRLVLTIPAEYKDKIQVRARVPKYLFGENKMGAICGELEYYCGDEVIEKVPLILERDTEKASALMQAIDRSAIRYIK